MPFQEASSSRHGLTREQAKRLCDQVLSFAGADHTRVSVESGWRGFTRTAMNRVTTAGGSRDVRVRITSVFGKRTATFNSNRIEPDNLKAAVEQS